jgi:hypothetical protein
MSTTHVPALAKLNRKVIQGYFLTVANVNIVPVAVSVVFTIKFPIGGTLFPDHGVFTLSNAEDGIFGGGWGGTIECLSPHVPLLRS